MFMQVDEHEKAKNSCGLRRRAGLISRWSHRSFWRVHLWRRNSEHSLSVKGLPFTLTEFVHFWMTSTTDDLEKNMCFASLKMPSRHNCAPLLKLVCNLFLEQLCYLYEKSVPIYRQPKCSQLLATLRDMQYSLHL